MRLLTRAALLPGRDRQKAVNKLSGRIPQVTKIVKPIIDSLKPQGKAGRPPVVRHCPYCHAAMNVTAMKQHRPQCARDHRNAPPQERLLPPSPPLPPMPPPPTPADLENQELSADPLQRERQLDQQEQDRIERTTQE
ncbi:MAG: hypothetical protein ABSF98_05925 [Bryobacteraceae bacterium]